MYRNIIVNETQVSIISKKHRNFICDTCLIIYQDACITNICVCKRT